MKTPRKPNIPSQAAKAPSPAAGTTDAFRQVRAPEPLFKSSERFHLDPESPVPLYHQMEQIIMDRIEAEGAVGRRLPGEMELVRIFGVSRITVTKAKDNLAAKGLIRRRRALGTHVVSTRVIEDLGRLTSYTEQMEARGLKVSTEIVSVTVAPPGAKVRERLQLAPGEKTLCLRRLRGTSKVFPVVLLQSDIPARYGLQPTEDFCGSLYHLLETEYGIPIEWGEEQISAARASADEARFLRIQPGDVVLVMERLTFTSGNQPVEFVRAVYRPEHYTFSVRLKR